MKMAATRCCVVALARQFEEELLGRYRDRHWANVTGELLRERVCITELLVSFEPVNLVMDGAVDNSSQDVSSIIPNSIIWSDICDFPELNPPSVMPQGNVGTPTAVFMELISQCKLPSRLIKKLNLEFPKSRSKRRYGAVSLDYGGDVEKGGSEDDREGESVGNKIDGDEKKKDFTEDYSEEKIPSVSLHNYNR